MKKSRGGFLSKKSYIKFLIALIFFIIIGVIIGFLFTTTDCGTDKQCFNDLAQACKQAKVKTLVGYNTYQIESKGISFKNFKFNECKIDVKVMSVETSDAETYNLFKDTEMTCRIPKGEVKEFTEFRDILKYCHGTLKEALFEKIIKEMYNRIVRNLEGIAVQASKVVSQVGL